MSVNVEENVISIIEDVKESLKAEETPKCEKQINLKTKTSRTVLKGKPKSGRFWKSERERFTSVNQTKGVKLDFQRKTALRLALKRTKEMARQAAEDLKQKVLQKKERRRENIKQAEEKKQKSEIVQVITNTAKLKRMRKKQLRFIEKRDTNKQASGST